jgi:hypothetical protein
MSAPIVFMDTECDGLRPDRKVWEVAIVRREPDGRETEWQAFVDIDLSTAEPFGLRSAGSTSGTPLADTSPAWTRAPSGCASRPCPQRPPSR